MEKGRQLAPVGTRRDTHNHPGQSCHAGNPLEWGMSWGLPERKAEGNPPAVRRSGAGAGSGPGIRRGHGDSRDSTSCGFPRAGEVPPVFPDPSETASPTLPQRMGTQRCHPAVATAGSPRGWHLPPPPQNPLSPPGSEHGHRSGGDALPVPIAVGARGPRAPPPPPLPSPDKGTAPAAPAAPPSPLGSAAGQSRHAWLPPTGRARTPCPGGRWGCPAVPAALEGWGIPEPLQPLRGAAAPGCGEVPPSPPPRAQGPKVMDKDREGRGGDPAAHPPAASMGEERGAESTAGPRALTPDFETANTAHSPGDTTGTRRGHRGPAPDPTAP